MLTLNAESPAAFAARAGLLAGAVGFAAFVYALLPSRNVAFNDDFAYLRSVVETIQHGRPWTNDFLEPWAMSLSVISAGVFKATGSFLLATLGLQIVASGASFYLIARLVQTETGSTAGAMVIAAAVLTFPTVLWKQSEYTAMVVYLPLLLGSLLAAERSRWGWFFLCWAAAVASRQCALAWLFLPLAAAVHELISRPAGRRGFAPALCVLAGGGWFYVLSRYANPTHARRLITSQFASSLDPQTAWANAMLAAWVCATALGVFALARWMIMPGARAAAHPRWLRGIGVAIALALLVSAGLVGLGVPIGYEHPLFENASALWYLRALVVLGALGWIIHPPRLALPFASAAVASLALACLRPKLWDYYLTDGVVIAVTGLLSARPVTASGSRAERRTHLLLFGALAAAVVAAHLGAATTLKRLLDRHAAACVVLEKALRSGWMTPADLSDSPFGFAAWHLVPYYLAHDGRESGRLGGFQDYVARRSVGIHIAPARRNDSLNAPRPTHPFSEVHRHGWFGYARFTLVRAYNPRPPLVPILMGENEPQLFPLTNAEWRTLIQPPPDDPRGRASVPSPPRTRAVGRQSLPRLVRQPFASFPSFARQHLFLAKRAKVSRPAQPPGTGIPGRETRFLSLTRRGRDSAPYHRRHRAANRLPLGLKPLTCGSWKLGVGS
ncbi:MAG TPA: hypothetical protein VHE61_03595 [Opitutaceae bacterium]|nr:hypothetical protein [Opitutaceae bacterium]